MEHAADMHQSGVRKRSMRGRVHARSDAVHRKQHADVRLERSMGQHDGMHELGMRQRGVHRRLHAGSDAVLGQRRANVRSDRALGCAQCVHESNLRRQRLHGRVRTGAASVQQPDSADVRDERPVAERRRLPERVQWRRVLRHVQPWSNTVQQSDAANVR